MKDVGTLKKEKIIIMQPFKEFCAEALNEGVTEYPLIKKLERHL